MTNFLQHLNVECFDELLFTEGIATKDCYCSNAAGSKIYGFDENKKTIVSIDFAGDIDRTCYEFKDSKWKTAKWLQMLNAYDQNRDGFLALVNLEGERGDFLIRFTLADNNVLCQTESVLVDYSEQSDAVRLLQLADSKRNFYVKMEYCRTIQTTTITVIEIMVGRDAGISLQSIHQSIIVDGVMEWPFEENEEETVGMNLFSLPLLEKTEMKHEKHLSDSFIKRHFTYVCPVLGSSKNEIYFLAYSELLNVNELLGIDMTTKKIRQHFTLNERPVKTNMVLFVNDRIIINGESIRKKQWHAYHFVITEKLIPFCLLNLNEISCILSEDERIVYCGEARVQMVFAWILRRLYKNKLSPIFLFVSEATYLSYYKLTLSRLPAAIRNSVLVFSHEKRSKITLDKDFVTHNCDNLSYEEKTALAKLEVSFLAILNTTVFAGFDHPRERIKWLGVKSAENPICMAAPSNDPGSLNLYFPDWETRFKDNHDSATILIPPCADLETMFAHKSESNAFGENAERDLIESLMKLRIGGLILSGIKSKKFLKAHSVSKQFLKSHSAFEIDVLLLHQKYGIIVFECKAIIRNEDIPLRNDERVTKAQKQLHRIGHAMSTVYQAYDSHHPKCFISLVIALPNSMLSAINKVNYEKQNQLAIWDKEDLQETQLRSKLSSIEKAIHASAIFADDPVQNGAKSDNDPFKKFTKITTACRSNLYLSPKLNIMALHHGIAHHAYLNPKKGQSSQALKHIRLSHGGGLQIKEQHVYLSREQEEILNDTHNFHIVSGPPGTGKTLLMQLKALNLARNEDFTNRIVLYSGSESSLAEVRQVFELNLTKQHHFPEFWEVNQSTKQDQLAAFFADELSANRDLLAIMRWRQVSSGPTFLCITGRYLPGNLTQHEVEKQLKAIAEINIKHSFLTTIYRGTEKIINYWKSSYAKIPDIKIGHRIRGNRVEEYSDDYFKQIYGRLITGLEDFCLYESDDIQRAVCAVLLDDDRIADAVRAFISSKGFACGSSREYINNPRLITVDLATNCLSLEWPVVFYIETGVQPQCRESSRLIASSRAMVKLVILNRNFMKLSEKFLEKVEELSLSLTDMSISTFRMIILETQQSLYEADMDEIVDQCTHTDHFHVTIRHAFWPSELKSHPGLVADNLYDALAVLNKNTELLFKILSCTEFNIIQQKNLVRMDKGEIPEYLFIVWKGLSEKEVEKRWTICRELCEQITGLLDSFAKDAIKKASDKLKELFSGDGYWALKHMANNIWRLYAVCMW